MNLKKETTAGITVALVLIVSGLTLGITQQQQQPQQQVAYAAGAAGTLDPNGVLRMNPLASAGPFDDEHSIAFDNEYYISNAIKNFRSDGSMRIDWKGKPASMNDTDGTMLAGYFNIDRGGERTSGNDCTANPTEEISTKTNGGPHNNNDPEWADVFDSGVIKFNGDSPSRMRTEETHPEYSSAYPGRSLSGGWPIQSTNLCTIPGGWVGVMTFKINIDKDDDGQQDDAVRILHYVDESGLSTTTGKPKNNWELVYYQEFAVPDGTDLKSMLQPYVCTIGECDEHYETIRVDQQSQSRWQSTSNPPYKFVTYKTLDVVE